MKIKTEVGTYEIDETEILSSVTDAISGQMGYLLNDLISDIREQDGWGGYFEADGQIIRISNLYTDNVVEHEIGDMVIKSLEYEKDQLRIDPEIYENWKSTAIRFQEISELIEKSLKLT